MLYTLRFFSSKCSLFHNADFFGSCIIHILYTGVLKLKKIIPAPKVKVLPVSGIQNRNGIGEIRKSGRRKKGRKRTGMNE